MTPEISFSKLHGLGNDFILIDAINQEIDIKHIQQKTKALCNRHTGIGADGIILALPSKTADIKMIIYNSDGSSPEMCGNGLRCFSEFIYINKITTKTTFTVETDAGILSPKLLFKNNKLNAIKVSMGSPQYDKKIMPKHAIPFHQNITINNIKYDIYIVSMGNPHAIIFLDTLTTIDWETIGKKMQQIPQFPDGVNCEFVSIKNRQEADLVVWERGVGKTLACGTGACAAAVAGIHLNLLDTEVTMNLPGGPLQINYNGNNDNVIMTGPSKYIFSGKLIR